MAQIQVNHLTFYYEGSYEEIFNDVSFSVDTDWKLGFIGRNGRGKTTFLNLLMGNMNTAVRYRLRWNLNIFLLPSGIRADQRSISWKSFIRTMSCGSCSGR